ncbi:MAG: peptide ABC transporter substrate-binding protein [Candidatus Parcubacteria bacterium]|nr:peptide ABC transporter substrate-binding protein [Candidatus Parcubacteria bacterium]
MIIKLVYILRNFSLREKVIFFALAAIFVVSSISILWKISGYYSVEIPAAGGALKEGLVGTPRFINPLLAISDADKDLTGLVYSGLMRPDNKGGLIPDLAEKFEISQDGLSYTFTLRENLVWQDDKPITIDDIIFTVQQAKDSQLKSSKRANWDGVGVEKIDDRTVRFNLSKPYAPFLENTILGILPKHIWRGAVSEQMSLSEFNIKPVGSGPYEVKNITRDSSGIVTSYELSPNKKFSLGKPFINNLIIRFYPSEKELLAAFQRGEIESISAVNPSFLEKIKKNSVLLKTPFLPRVFGVFFNQNNAKIFTQKEVRDALTLATDKKRIIDEILQGFGEKLEYPIPPGVFGALTEEKDNFSTDRAKEILQKNGWIFNEKESVWEKTTGSGKKKETARLEFSLATSDAPELKQTGELLKNMWENLGAKVNLKIFETGDLNQNIIQPRKYDALLFGEVLGRNPDPFVFWHSSQRTDPGLNIALYANVKTDKLLEDIRTISDEAARQEKYKEFQKEIARDNPAIFLFSPKFIYLLPNYLRGVDEMESVTVPSERFSQVYKWYIKTDKVWKIFAK